MYYYKKLNQSGELESLQSCASDLSNCDSELIPISKEEFDEITAEIDARVEAEKEAAAQAQRDYVAELEAENAALLYQLLTGEEFADV